jgi:hypothetical protein
VPNVSNDHEQLRDDAEQAQQRARPLHMQVMVVMADGAVMSVELPTAPQDHAEFTWDVQSAYDEDTQSLMRGPEERMRKVTFTAEVLYRRPLGRPEGLCRVGTYGGAAAMGQVPGREVPEHVVTMLAQILAGWSPGMVRPGDLEYPKVVRGQATLTAQAIWDQAFYAGMQHAHELGMTRQRIAGGLHGPIGMKLPLFDPDGNATWLPPACPECHEEVTGIERKPGDLANGQGQRQVTTQPCGHLIWAPDPVTVTLS